MQAKVILFCGKICTGKSFYAKILKEKINAVILSTDEATYDLIKNEQGEFYNDFALRVNNYLKKKAAEIVSAGATVILDWGFWTAKERIEISDYFFSHGIKYEWHYIEISEETHKKRIYERNQKILSGENKSDFYVDDALLNKCLSLFEEPLKQEIDVWHKNG